jgi:hypothetical protein
MGKACIASRLPSIGRRGWRLCSSWGIPMNRDEVFVVSPFIGVRIERWSICQEISR